MDELRVMKKYYKEELEKILENIDYMIKLDNNGLEYYELLEEYDTLLKKYNTISYEIKLSKSIYQSDNIF
jgi:hypothetical protein